MIFMCCHPEIPRDASVALSLKTVGGFSVREIARAFLAEEAPIAQRLVRAKRQIREQRLTLDLPGGADWTRASIPCSMCSTSCSTRAMPRMKARS